MQVHSNIHGAPSAGGQGGSYFDLKTKNSDRDLAYNREFQKASFLAETPNRVTDNDINPTLLADFGLIEANQKSTDFRKRAPHPKYY